MGSKKKGRGVIKMDNPNSNHRYYTSKNKKNCVEKLSILKYAPDLRQHVLFTEMK